MRDTVDTGWIPIARDADGAPAPLEGRFAGAPVLPGVDHRTSLVESVRRLNPHALDEGLLRCDLASAHLAAGRRDSAVRSLDEPAARSALVLLAERMLGPDRLDADSGPQLHLSARLGPGLADLARLAALAGELFEGSRFPALAAELDIDLRLRRNRTTAALATPLSRWIEAPGIGTLMGDAARHRRVDLRAVPPRLVTWSGALRDEIATHHLADGGVRVLIPLARQPRPEESLRLFAADSAGRVLADVPLRLTGDHLVAEHHGSGTGSWFGIHSEGTDPGPLASRAVGRAVDAERLLIDSWSSSRLVLAAAVAVAAEQSRHGGPSSTATDDLITARLTAPLPSETAAAAKHEALRDEGGDPGIIAATFADFADRRAWDLPTTSVGPFRPLLSELVHVLSGGRTA
ncbi:hypothetical protein [Rathayibacter sp. Leaf296]|uniref:hypothetical protein n=1 Tax=Rathayibacter sp. Leaf296 TaxID=1736327 RepID=UPI0007025B8C|nr:hypothetical protein [Rathayibacter sp. Leaf296]KQQ07568.1 hypothetical protein ASF46_18185 [Rathayibacter sp. Leaf296]